MSLYVQSAFATKSFVSTSPLEVEHIHGNYYKHQNTGQISEYPRGEVHESREAAEAAGRQELFEIKQRIEDFLND